MRTKLMVLALIGLALAGADSAMASDHPPCEPNCDLLDTADLGGSADVSSLAPLFVAMAALFVAPRRLDKEPS